ncbi:MAG: efflux RND transporter periplasmic adaptor subunit [Candidatus Shapirobacteria bacterium]|jgi:RND family efflux transporter MFP subunit
MIFNKKNLLIGVIILALGYFGYSYFFKSEASKTTYQTARAQKGTLVVNLDSSGQVAATNSRTVTTTASGVVKKVYVKEGQQVRTGTPILSIELDLNGSQKLQAAYAAYQSAQNNLKTTEDKLLSLQSDLVNTKNIFDNQYSQMSPDDPSYIQKHNAFLLAQENYDNLQNSIKQSRSSLESARLSYQMASSTVYAPISGTVSAISLFPGMILNPTSDSANSTNASNKIAIVKTGATPAITVNLTEIDVPKVKVGNKATVTFDALPDKTFSGKIIAIDTAGSISSGVANYPVTIQLDSGTEDILSNMSANVSIITDFKDSVVYVPVSAVKSENGVSKVSVMENGTPKSVDVTTGIQSTTSIEIVSGINDGDEVVTATVSSGSSTTTKSTSSPFSGLGGGQARFIGR